MAIDLTHVPPRKKPPGPERISFKAPELLSSGSRVQFLLALQQEYQPFWVHNFTEPHGALIDHSLEPVHAAHSCPPDNAGDSRFQLREEITPGCLGCALVAKEREGRPVLRYHLTVMRDVSPVVMVTQPKKAKVHRKRKCKASYHNRIQKKWNKRVLGQTEQVCKREIVLLSVPTGLVRYIRDKGLYRG